MAAEFTKITTEDKSEKGVSDLPDTPNLTATQLKERFDSLALLAIDAINRLIDELQATSAASKIGTANGTLQSWISSCQTAVQRNTRNISANSLAITSLETETSNLNEQMSTATANIDNLDMNVSSLNEDNLTLDQRISDLERYSDIPIDNSKKIDEINSKIGDKDTVDTIIYDLNSAMLTANDAYHAVEGATYTLSGLSDLYDSMKSDMDEMTTDSEGTEYSNLADTITDILNRLKALEGGTTV